MTDTDEISERALTLECERIAQDAFDEARGAPDFCPLGDRDDMMDRVTEAVDGHQWVIYHYKALRVCVDCNVDNGEAFLEDVGPPPQKPDPGFDRVPDRLRRDAGPRVLGAGATYP